MQNYVRRDEGVSAKASRTMDMALSCWILCILALRLGEYKTAHSQSLASYQQKCARLPCLCIIYFSFSTSIFYPSWDVT
jgi:hypothetical protein